VRKTDSDRCSLIKGQGQLSANLSGQLFIIAGRGGGKGWRMMNNDFIMHVYDRNYSRSSRKRPPREFRKVVATRASRLRE